MFYFKYLIILFYFLLYHFTSFAGDTLYGAEFTFTSDSISGAGDDFGNYEGQEGIAQAQEFIDMQKKYVEFIREKICKKNKCKITETEYRDNRIAYKVTYPDGWWFKIFPDPAVIEVITKPSTLKKIKQKELLIQSDIFDAAKSVKLRAHLRLGGGHISVDAKLFDAHPSLLRNFFVDWMNHYELAEGILTATDFTSARSLLEFPTPLVRKLQKILKEFDDGKIRSTKVLAKKLYDEIEKQMPIEDQYGGREIAVNLRNIFEYSDPKQRRLEIRSIRAQRSAHDFSLLVELIEKRLEFLLKINRPVFLLENAGRGSFKNRIDRFYTYVFESGLNWEEYRKLLVTPYLGNSRGSKPCSQAAIINFLTLNK